MTNEQKENVREMRGAGASYAKIARALGLSENTVQSFCRRSKLTDESLKAGEPNGKGALFCLNCGIPIKQTPGYRGRKYCSDRCRISWWNKHPVTPGRKSTRSFTCLACGKLFDAYSGRERKYCSRSCSAGSKGSSR
ncbi:MAG: RNA polymerase subunit sigma-70 [Eubacteriales bacterium]|nr:RNA polymerase subunit sigma-70 [Eubacteriales bacterium]